MQLSIRLRAVADMAKNAARLADIGTDHGYVPIFLMQEGGLEFAIAMDVNRGPLKRAQEHIQQYRLEDRIVTRLSDGACNLRQGEVDTVVIAGMGGPLTIKILTEGKRVLSDVCLILQPQSEIGSVRRFLHSYGFCITEENMVKDDGKFYPMMRAIPGEQEVWDDSEYRYGKLLMEQKNSCLLEFLEKEERTCRHVLNSLEYKTGEHIRIREQQLQQDLTLIQRAKNKLKV